MRKSILATGLSAATFALISMAPVSAFAQGRSQPDPQTIAAAVRYSLPLALSGVNAACASSLSRDGFLATNGSTLVTRYSKGADAYWPQARTLFLKLASEKGGADFAFLTELPDEALKPLASALIPEMIGEEMDAETCKRVELVMEQLAPLPVGNIAQLTSLIMQIIQEEEAKEAADTKEESAR